MRRAVHTTIQNLANNINAAFVASSYPDMFDRVQHELDQLMPSLGIAVAKYPEFKKDDQYFPALKKEFQQCQEVLNDLQELQKYYDDLPSHSRVAWERTGIGASSLTGMQARITSSRQTFTMLNTQLIR
ncbi:hypothetical protein N7509_007465 [Penicillium cosmopolitanum]|uniref:NACHT-NTPase and P-loop NTPases N-terminal domain-containing protein n=1 Tax=Penicillium cosmopolitanum TaxID=1131564 RepID=A0A9W9VZ69_9EURO|nr:uncharacterized protein N7509_007465 [Penicillium cosmopolitanum]KAJ5391975.1 hypothetical protein N7509_007465 [Penicillium cosmopolitanum]